MAKKRKRVPRPRGRKTLRELKDETKDYCVARLRELFGPGFVETITDSRRWIERINQDEKDAHPAVVKLRQALHLARTYFRKHPQKGDLPLRIRGRKVRLDEAAAIYSVDELLEEADPSWSNHGAFLREIRAYLEEIFESPWARENRGAVVWENRVRVVQLHDCKYNDGVLRKRSSLEAGPNRLTSTELAWISIAYGEWPNLHGTDHEPAHVVRAEAKRVESAKKTLRKRGAGVPIQDRSS